MLSIFRDFVSLIYPVVCLGCGRNEPVIEGILCYKCYRTLPVAFYLWEERNPLEILLMGRILSLGRAYAFLEFSQHSVVQHLLHQLKYNHKKQVGYFLGKEFATLLMQRGKTIQADFIIPVPLHQKKLRMRGYNQSMEIAKGIAEVWNINIAEKYLFRSRFTETQTRKSRQERKHNVEGGFYVEERGEVLKDKICILVDDVVTTGATIEACAQVLEEAGVLEINILTLAMPQY